MINTRTTPITTAKYEKPASWIILPTRPSNKNAQPRKIIIGCAEAESEILTAAINSV